MVSDDGGFAEELDPEYVYKEEPVCDLCGRGDAVVFVSRCGTEGHGLYLCSKHKDMEFFCNICDPDPSDYERLCPVCGELVHLTGLTKDGRLIGSCGDAFTQERWDDIED